MTLIPCFGILFSLFSSLNFPTELSLFQPLFSTEFPHWAILISASFLHWISSLSYPYFTTLYILNKRLIKQLFPDFRRRRPRFEFPGSTGAGPRHFTSLHFERSLLLGNFHETFLFLTSFFPYLCLRESSSQWYFYLFPKGLLSWFLHSFLPVLSLFRSDSFSSLAPSITMFLWQMLKHTGDNSIHSLSPSLHCHFQNPGPSAQTTDRSWAHRAGP